MKPLARIILACCASRAAAEGLTTSGVLQTSFERISIETANGTKSTNAFQQSYAMNAGVPLLTDDLGFLNAGFTYRQGDNVARLASGQTAGERATGISLGGVLTPAGASRLISIAPHYGRQEHQDAWQGGPTRQVVDTSMGGAVGLTVPGLPAMSVDVNDVGHSDSNQLGVTDLRTRTVHERANWIQGPVRVTYDRTTRITGFGAGTAPGTRQSMLAANANAEWPELKTGVLKTGSASLSFFGDRSGTLGRTQERDGLAGRGDLGSVARRAGPAEFHLRYGQSFNRQFQSRTGMVGGDLSLIGRLWKGTWTGSNELRGEMRSGGIPMPAAVLHRLSAESPRWRDRVKWWAQSDESVRWGAVEGERRDVFLHRVTVYPHRRLDVYGEQSYSGVTPREGGRSRGFGWGGGGTVRPHAWVEVSGTADTGETVAPGSILPQRVAGLAGWVRIVVPFGMNATVGWQRRESGYPGMAMTGTDTFSAEASYAPLAGLTLNARVARSGQRGMPGRSNPTLDSSATASYRIGRTAVSSGWESRAMSMPNAYARFNISLTRSI